VADLVADPIGVVLAVLRVFGALALSLFVPGLFLVNAMYPRKGELDREYDRLYRLTLAIFLSLALTILWSFALNALGVDPQTSLGFVVGTNIAIGLVGLSAVFFVVGWWRGAYTFLGKVHPALTRMPSPAPTELLTDEDRDHRVRLQLQELAARREVLRRAIRDAERRMRLQSDDARTHYEEKRDRARTELKTVEVELRKLEEERAAELY